MTNEHSSDATAENAIGSGLLADIQKSDFDPLIFGKQPLRQIRGISEKFDPLARQGVGIPALRAALRAVGIDASERTVRRYIERELPEIYSELYARTVRKKSPRPPVANTNMSQEQRKKDTSYQPGPAKNWKEVGSIYDPSNRVRANADDYFGAGMSDTFSFLKPRHKKGTD